VGCRFRRRRRLFLRIDSPKPACTADARMAGPSCLSRLSACESSSGARGTGPILFLRSHSTKGTSQQRRDVCRRLIVGCRDPDHSFFENHPLLVKGADFRALRDREISAAEEAPGASRVRAAGATGLWDESPRQRSRSIDEVLAGSSETARQAHRQSKESMSKIQSDLHGDMQS
jgi:hypothetical protein